MRGVREAAGTARCEMQLTVFVVRALLGAMVESEESECRCNRRSGSRRENAHHRCGGEKWCTSLHEIIDL